MERLTQKFIRYFYFTLIGGIILQLANVVTVSIKSGIGWRMFAVVFLSIVNLVLLISDVRHNIKQQFTESKLETKLLRFTIIPLLVFQVWICLLRGFSGIVLGDYIMSAVIIEIILNHKIKCIEHLEELANKLAEENLLKGGTKCQQKI